MSEKTELPFEKTDQHQTKNPNQGSTMRYISRTARCGILFRDEAFKEIGLTGTQHNYIAVIHNHSGIYQHQLAKKLIVNKSNITRQLNLLEQNGFITRRLDSNNRRQVNVYPTDKAIESYPKIRQVLANWNDILLQGFTDDEKLQLNTLLDKVYQNALLATEGTLMQEESL